MSKLSSLMVMIGICAFLGNKPTWAGENSSSKTNTEKASHEVQFAPAVAEQFASTPSLVVVGGIVAGGLGLMALRRKPA